MYLQGLDEQHHVSRSCCTYLKTHHSAPGEFLVNRIHEIWCFPETPAPVLSQLSFKFRLPSDHQIVSLSPDSWVHALVLRINPNWLLLVEGLVDKCFEANITSFSQVHNRTSALMSRKMVSSPTNLTLSMPRLIMPGLETRKQALKSLIHI